MWMPAKTNAAESQLAEPESWGGGAEKKKTQPVELSCRTEKNTTKTQIDGTSEQCTLFSRI